MKLHNLEIEGFGPFRSRQRIDFDAFDGDGLFLISGKTGAGKSSILDAVCFALYGSIPRYSAGEKGLRSDYSELGEVSEIVLEFSVATGRYRIARSPEYARPKARGTGTTVQKAQVELAVWKDGDWAGLGARAKDVDGEFLREILQLSREQFLQVILLAQNGFAGFLKAGSGERLKVLRTLFGTERFDAYAADLAQRRKDAAAVVASGMDALNARLGEAEAVLADAREILPAEGDAAAATDGATDADTDADTDVLADAGVLVDAGAEKATDAAANADDVAGSAASDPAPPRLTRLETAHLALPRLDGAAEAARDARAGAEAEHGAALTALNDARALAAQQRDLAAARHDLATLDETTPAVDADRGRLRAAEDAEALRAFVEALAQSEAALTLARAAVTEAEPRWVLARRGALTPPGTAADATAPDATAPDATDPDAPASGAPTDAAAVSDAVALRSEAATAASLVGTLAAALDAERDHPAVLAESDNAIAAVTAAEADILAHADRVASLPERITEAEASMAALAPQAAGVEAAQALVTERTALREAARRAEDAAERARLADVAALEAGTAMRAASEHVSNLIARRLRGYAGELAGHLTDGAPCAVCGSTSHPAPAPAGDDPVTDDDVTRAQQSKDTAVTADQRATTAATAARDELTAAVAAAGGHTVDAATALIGEAEAAVAAATNARTAHARLTVERDALTAERDAAALALETLRGVLAAAQTRAATAAERVRHATQQIAAGRAGWPSVAARRTAIEEHRVSADALATLLDDAAARERTLADVTARFETALASSTFADRTAVNAALLPAPERSRLDALVRDHDDRRARLRGVVDRLVELAPPTEPVDLTAPAERLTRAEEVRTTAERTLVRVDQTRAAFVRALTAADDAQAHIGDAATRLETIQRLADSVNGQEPNTMKMSLETFVLAAELEEIVAAANVRLAEMSTGRYSLAHTDGRAAHGAASGLGIEVVDAHTGRGRPATSLSGGETFLASLALALGLAEVVTARAGGVRLDTLFIDEGFGSLDAETLDTAMRTLDALRAGGRTVGVISHVEAMHHQIPARLTVRAQTDGSSVVVQEDEEFAD